MKFKVVIPARYSSNRFPGKPLVDIHGKPMIWHTYQRALETGMSPKDIIIATDDSRIYEAAASFGASVVLTSDKHESGTSRLAEVADLMKWDLDEVIVNLQADEPLLPPELITLTAETLLNCSAGIATLACPIQTEADVKNPNIVKLVRNAAGDAMYFSRASVPFVRDGLMASMFEKGRSPWLRHIGTYAYRVKTLRDYVSWPVCLLEDHEKLEQLRALYHGVTIKVAITDIAPVHGVDTPDDLEKLINVFNKPTR